LGTDPVYLGGPTSGVGFATTLNNFALVRGAQGDVEVAMELFDESRQHPDGRVR
jgi:hypothetical protein